jgi:hypothetical protein
MISRFTEGPVGFITIKPNKAPSMGGGKFVAKLSPVELLFRPHR